MDRNKKDAYPLYEKDETVKLYLVRKETRLFLVGEVGPIGKKPGFLSSFYLVRKETRLFLAGMSGFFVMIRFFQN